MALGLIGRKLGMTQIFAEDGRCIPVTVIQAGPCKVVGKRGQRVQLAFEPIKSERATKPQRKIFSASGGEVYRHLKEFPVPNEDIPLGQMVKVGLFKVGDRVDIVGRSKGKGFAGVMKRHHFAGGPASHGSMFHRAPGSIGSNTFPGRTLKNKRMPGHMGDRRVSVLNLRVAKVEEARDLLLVEGAVPGWRNSLVVLRLAVKQP